MLDLGCLIQTFTSRLLIFDLRGGLEECTRWSIRQASDPSKPYSGRKAEWNWVISAEPDLPVSFVSAVQEHLSHQNVSPLDRKGVLTFTEARWQVVAFGE
jgi:hypothetical protein